MKVPHPGSDICKKWMRRSFMRGQLEVTGAVRLPMWQMTEAEVKQMTVFRVFMSSFLCVWCLSFIRMGTVRWNFCLVYCLDKSWDNPRTYNSA